MLLPLVLLWEVEERLRARELSSLRRERRQAERVAGEARVCPAEEGAGCLPESPLSLRLLVGWMAASALLLWLLLEALLL